MAGWVRHGRLSHVPAGPGVVRQARSVLARSGKVRHRCVSAGQAWQARFGKSWVGSAWFCWVRQVTRGKSGRGQSRFGRFSLGAVRFGRQGPVVWAGQAQARGRHGAAGPAGRGRSLARQVVVWQGRRGQARHGQVRKSGAWHDLVRRGSAGKVGLGYERLGMSRTGGAWQVRLGVAVEVGLGAVRLGSASRGLVRQAWLKTQVGQFSQPCLP